MSTRATKPQAVARQALADRVYEEIFASVVDGRLEAGASISIDGIARDLTVSPTPVREALARLESTGLVLRVALKGYRIAPLFTPNELAELMDARLVIEPVNALRACQRATPELTDALAQAIMDLRNAPQGAAFAGFRDSWAADERFHRLIAESGANKFILSAYHSLGGQIQRFRYFGDLGVTDADHAIEEHTSILEAFLARDPEAARDAMIAHIASVRRRARP
jgi:DNA-binding GntR family transcriptional regulator